MIYLVQVDKQYGNWYDRPVAAAVRAGSKDEAARLFHAADCFTRNPDGSTVQQSELIVSEIPAEGVSFIICLDVHEA